MEVRIILFIGVNRWILVERILEIAREIIPANSRFVCQIVYEHVLLWSSDAHIGRLALLLVLRSLVIVIIIVLVLILVFIHLIPKEIIDLGGLNYLVLTKLFLRVHAKDHEFICQIYLVFILSIL